MKRPRFKVRQKVEIKLQHQFFRPGIINADPIDCPWLDE